jgi:glycosyltransferase involved in cell wall biosynthesis
VKILVLNYEFPPVGGGGGQVAADLCRELARRGHEVVVLTGHLAGLPRREERDGYLVVRVPTFRRRADRCSVPEMGGFVAMAVLPALRLARRFRPDVMHVHFAVPTGPVAWVVHRLLRIPYLLTAHLGDVPGGVPAQTDALFRVLRPLTVPIWRRAARRTAVSEFVRGLAERSYALPVETLPNAIDVSSVEPGPAAPHDPPRLAFIGRVSLQKNVPFVIEALARVRDLAWSLDIVGDGPCLPDVRRAVAQHGLGERVRFLGWVDPAEVRTRLRATDVVLFPSRSEGLSIVALLALATGVAVVASDVPGLAPVVQDHENGRTFAPDDVAAAAAALRDVLVAPERLAAMKAASRTRAARFDLQVVAARYETLLREAAA